MDTNQFSVIIQAVLEKSGISKELSEIQKIINNNMIKITPQLETANLRNNLKQISNEIARALNQSIGGDFKISGSDVFKALNASLKEMNTTIDVSSTKIQNLGNAMLAFKQNNTNMTRSMKKELDSMYNSLINGANMSEAEFKELSNQFAQFKLQVRDANRLGKSFPDAIGSGMASFATWLPASQIVMGGVNTIRKMIDAVYDLDTAMTNLYKVTDETDDRYNQFLDSATKRAKELGQSVTNLVEQTANWAKLGYSLNDAEKLAEISAIYANVGEVDNDTAVSDMVTAMKAFNIEASNAITIVDRLNALGNKYATSAAALGTGLSNSASALALAGNDIDQTLAMITAMTEITQDASESGNALKILSMRLRGMKGELQALGEESEGLESISKIQTQILNLTGGKVNIFKDDGNFKSTYEIMQGISEVWTEISQTNQAELLEIIAGKQRGNSISALLTNMAQANNALNDSINSSGSAQEEQERWMESLEAKTQQFKASFQSLSQTILDDNFLKGIVDFGSGAIDVLDEVFQHISPLGTAITGIITILNRDKSKQRFCPLWG